MCVCVCAGVSGSALQCTMGEMDAYFDKCGGLLSDVVDQL